MEMKWCIIGTSNDVYQDKIGEPYLDHYAEEVIATFDTKEMAEDYIKKSRLKQPKRRSFASTIMFRSKSLLSGCEDAEAQEFEEEYPPPHNPEI